MYLLVIMFRNIVIINIVINLIWFDGEDFNIY